MTHLRPLRKRLGLAALCAGLIALAPTARAAGADSEIGTAATHAGFASKAGAIEMVHAHMHHALNCLVGPAGAGFDSASLDPCKNSGNGAIPDTTDAARRATLEEVAASLRAGLKDDDLASARKTAAEAERSLRSMK